MRQLKAYTHSVRCKVNVVVVVVVVFVLHRFVYRLEKITSITLYMSVSRNMPLEFVGCSSPLFCCCCIWPFHTHSLSLSFYLDLPFILSLALSLAPSFLLFIFHYILSFFSIYYISKIIVNIISDSTIKTIEVTYMFSTTKYRAKWPFHSFAPCFLTCLGIQCNFLWAFMSSIGKILVKISIASMITTNTNNKKHANMWKIW